MTAAVVFLVFNRPVLTKRVFARIRDARPPQLFVVADGPRLDRPGEAEKCAEVRRVIEEGVDWPCELIRDYSDVNLGCGKRVASGITNAFKRVEEAIILEDDCLPDPTFFPFCEELLVRYRNQLQVGQIAGCSFQGSSGMSSSASYYFSRYPHCWGWATWRRAWQYYDFDMTEWKRNSDRKWLRQVIENRSELRWWTFNFSMTLGGRIDTWDFRWTLAFFRNRLLNAIPYRNLVSNIGFGPDATHTLELTGPQADLPVFAMLFPIVHPPTLSRDIGADNYSSLHLFRRPAIGSRCLMRIRHIFAKKLFRPFQRSNL
jgi:hypothetical protein